MMLSYKQGDQSIKCNGSMRVSNKTFKYKKRILIIWPPLQTATAPTETQPIRVQQPKLLTESIHNSI